MENIIVHYGEIALKKGNREYYERVLCENIKKSLLKEAQTVKRLYGRLLIVLNSQADQEKVAEKLRKIPGIINFSFAEKTSLDLEKIKDIVLKLAKAQDKKVFRIISKNANKNEFKYTSLELNQIIGSHVVENLGFKVDLEKPDVNFNIEVVNQNAYIYLEKLQSMGGLPTSTSGKLVSLISGGIDSPVASIRMIKRGCQLTFVHFYNFTTAKDAVKEKVELLVKKIAEYQGQAKLFLIPFKDLQHEIIKKVPGEYRMIVYRRYMLRIAEEILKKEGCKAFVTGDSLAQVASQTLDNISVIYSATSYPVLAPLMGEDKVDVIRESKKLGTYDISIMPYSDCCSLFVAEHPATKSDLKTIESFEAKIEDEKLIEDALKKAELKNF
ncbi:MAG TPA: tRNA uracil 4-sulfurtransferase ThiI [Candidatus Nanoarchaeia archaeon]|nr:tRNA uracil 4-sulfurtransferase ThiI [Candidatus Nanoarchaeia archaeon]